MASQQQQLPGGGPGGVAPAHPHLNHLPHRPGTTTPTTQQQPNQQQLGSNNTVTSGSTANNNNNITGNSTNNPAGAGSNNNNSNSGIVDPESVAAADKEMEERANRAKELLSQRYRGLKQQQEAKLNRKMQLERHMISLPEQKKQELRKVLEHEEMIIQKETRKRITPADFESLTVIGRGAFGEVRLVRKRNMNFGGHNNNNAGIDGVSSSSNGTDDNTIFALKSMKKEMMVLKNQVHHVKAERDALAQAGDKHNKWLTVLHYSFFDETHLYMAMEYMPGGDLMSLLIKEDTFSEMVTRFFMAEAAQAISSVHALGYIHRDIKPDNMLLDARGHLKLTDLGLCKKVGDVSPTDNPEVILAEMKGIAAVHEGAMAMSIDDEPTTTSGKQQQSRDPKTRREMAYSTVGTPDYIAPEVLAAQNGASGFSYTSAVDWWSLGVIMFECLVGYTPFYADDPVTTCRKILRWRQCLEMPIETKSQLSAECIDFLSCLLAGPESRIGSSTDGRSDVFENGFKQVIQHTWFRDFDWEGMREREGPLLPSGSREFPELLEYLKTCPKSDPRFKQLVRRVTQNFDSFDDFGDSNLDGGGGNNNNNNNAGNSNAGDDKSRRQRVQRTTQLDQFYNYNYRRVRKPRVPTITNNTVPLMSAAGAAAGGSGGGGHGHHHHYHH